MNAYKLSAILDQGPYAWPGGYPIYFVSADGQPLSFEAVQAEKQLIFEAMDSDCPDDREWKIVAAEINWEDPDLYCSHTNERIESAYAEEDDA